MLTKDTKIKALTRLRFCVVMACIFTGWLAGVDLEKYLVRLPTWQKLDIQMWAEYTRQSFFGYGFIIHQVEAACALASLVVASVIIRKYRLNFLAPQVYGATALVAFGNGLTFITAPIMYNLHELNNDPALLQAFNDLHYWGAYRAGAQILSFFLCAWAMGRCFVIRYVRI